ncbi:MAG TPA: hypothetical protein VMR74_12660 [Gammaproteobacteria bacterium]|nr:hypothetical protein [Gammaproteobacteria bacterium]
MTTNNSPDVDVALAKLAEQIDALNEQAARRQEEYSTLELKDPTRPAVLREVRGLHAAAYGAMERRSRIEGAVRQLQASHAFEEELRAKHKKATDWLEFVGRNDPRTRAADDDVTKANAAIRALLERRAHLTERLEAAISAAQ